MLQVMPNSNADKMGLSEGDQVFNYNYLKKQNIVLSYIIYRYVVIYDDINNLRISYIYKKKHFCYDILFDYIFI